MNLCKKNNKIYPHISLLAGTVFLLYLVLTPPIYNQTIEVISGKNLSNSVFVKQASCISAVFAENELLTDVVSYHIMSRNQQVSRQLPNLVCYAFAGLLAGYGVLVHNSQCSKQEPNQHTSLLAISRGGHAPPSLF